ncbi:gag-pol [Trichonephila clavipes]|nr:gag-pol [Trichonephila clavipes]
MHELGADLRDTDLRKSPGSDGIHGRLKEALSIPGSNSIWILSDSRSAIQHLSNWHKVGDNPGVAILEKLKRLSSSREIHLQWVPSHVNIVDNEIADAVAKYCVAQPTTNSARLIYSELHSTYINNKKSTISPAHYWHVVKRPGQDSMTVSRICGIDGFKTVIRNAGSQRPPITSSREDRHVTRVALMDRAATSRALSKQLRSFAIQQISAQTVRRQESRFCLQHQDVRLRIWWPRGERTMAACIRFRHTGISSDVMVWSDIGYTSRSPLVRTDSTLNSALYISNVLQPVVLYFIRALQNPTFQQDNA